MLFCGVQPALPPHDYSLWLNVDCGFRYWCLTFVISMTKGDNNKSDLGEHFM